MTNHTKAFVFKNDEKMNLTQVSMTAERIKLVSITNAFANDIFNEFTADIATYMIPSPANDINETKEFIARSIEGMLLQQELVLIISSPVGEFLGCVGLHGRGSYQTPELGIWLKKSAHGKKYGQEAIDTLLAWARKYVEFDYAIYPVDKLNIALSFRQRPSINSG